MGMPVAYIETASGNDDSVILILQTFNNKGVNLCQPINKEAKAANRVVNKVVASKAAANKAVEAARAASKAVKAVKAVSRAAKAASKVVVVSPQLLSWAAHLVAAFPQLSNPLTWYQEIGDIPSAPSLS